MCFRRFFYTQIFIDLNLNHEVKKKNSFCLKKFIKETSIQTFSEKVLLLFRKLFVTMKKNNMMRFKFIDPLLFFSLDQRKQRKTFLGTKQAF